MANPLAVFRKYEKILLAVFGVALIIVFTVGGIVSQYMNQGRGTTENKAIVSITSDTIRESDMQSLQFSRYHLRNFMRAVNLTAAERGATPQQSLGISDTDAEADLVQTAILARQAEAMGIEVSDDAIINSLIDYSQKKLGPGDFARILRDVTQGRMSQSQFFDAMRREMRAQQYLTLQQQGLMPPTPAAMWDYFLRLNRRVSLEAVPFEVRDYLVRVDEPTAGQIEALYEEGKNRYPFPDRPDPGFKKLKQVAIQYVRADLADYLAEAKASITNAQVQEYYDTNREEFRNIQLPTFDTPALPGDPGTEEGTPEAGAETSVPGDASLPGDASSLPETLSPDAATDAAESQLPDQQPLQDDPSDEGPKENSAPEPEPEQILADEPPAEDPSTRETEDVVAEPDAAEPAASDLPDAAQPDDPLEGLLESEPPEDPLADLPDAAGNNAAETRPEYKPLEEVEDTIRTRLATPLARQQMDQALSILRSEMKAYFGNFLAWDVSPDRDNTPQPTPPDLRPLAEQHGLTLGNIPLVTIFQLQETDPLTGEPLYEISRAYDTNYVPFAQYMFSDDLRMYEMRSIRGQVLDTEFLYWKTGEVAERVPELDEVREEVVRAIKMKQALELARQEAQAAADKLNQLNQAPRDLFASDPNRKVIEAQSISWMTPASVPYLPPRLTRIPGIKYPGDDFMRSVFSLAPGQAGTAIDNPQTTVYLVAVTRVDSDEDQLREQFMRTGMTSETTQLAQRDGQRHLQEWYTALEKELGVKWERDPLPDSRAR